MKKNTFLFLIVLFVFGVNAHAQELKVAVEGSMNTENLNYSIQEAGEDFSGETTGESVFYLTIEDLEFWNKNQNNELKWRVFVQHSNENWNEDLKLQIKRTGKGVKKNGNGTPNIHDGDNYQEVTISPSYFIRGKNEVSLIPLSVIIEGFSLSMGASEFESDLIFTVYEGW